MAANKKQKTMTADHVLAALKEVEFEHLVPELELQLANYRKIMKDKKDRKSTGIADKATEEDTDEVEIVDEWKISYVYI